ncbi:MAG: hypothetical protein M5U05_13255 [Anaerolineales bacterium]|nr:hypothetical protein [Anaerolineales bacterium]
MPARQVAHLRLDELALGGVGAPPDDPPVGVERVGGGRRGGVWAGWWVFDFSERRRARFLQRD